MRQSDRAREGVVCLKIVIPSAHGRFGKLTLKSGGTLSSDLEFFEYSKDREAAARFNAFYDFAFPRIYRYAQRRMQDEGQAQVLCRLVFIRAMASFGGMESGLDGIEDRMKHDEVGFAFWLFCLARRSADDLNGRLAENPELFASSDLADLELGFDDPSIEMLRGARALPKTWNDKRSPFESS